MNRSQDKRSPHWRRSSLSGALAIVALMIGASLAAIALGAGTSVTVTSAANSTLGERIVVDAKGRTVYVLSPETTHHLLCKSSECLKFWPPLTVGSSKTKLKAGAGVRGRLTIFRRNNGILQVALGGLPLYRYSGDQVKGEANGQDIRGFGGTWHVLTTASHTSPTNTTSTTPTTPAPTTPTTPTAPSPTPGYGY